ncbi:hypothetical protein PM8797T_25681 [Gimesia maris DSM 8797]|nr:hypothetical protein PM8797T_25681 [Gimesia maris DSM 8797]
MRQDQFVSIPGYRMAFVLENLPVQMLISIQDPFRNPPALFSFEFHDYSI